MFRTWIVFIFCTSQLSWALPFQTFIRDCWTHDYLRTNSIKHSSVRLDPLSWATTLPKKIYKIDLNGATDVSGSGECTPAKKPSAAGLCLERRCSIIECYGSGRRLSNSALLHMSGPSPPDTNSLISLKNNLSAAPPSPTVRLRNPDKQRHELCSRKERSRGN